MSYEVTRASSADRLLYAEHLGDMYAEGRITQEEMEHKAVLILKAQTLHQLDDLMEGLPRPGMPPQPRDYSIPRNFLKAGFAATLGGLTLTVGVTTALGGHHGAFAATVSALCMLWGIWITIVAIVVMIVKGVGWDDLDKHEQQERRRKDQQGR